jgi:hypothetical protein
MTTEMSQIRWPYPLLEVSQNKRTPRVGVYLGSAHELVGVDGNAEGSLRPFPGFLKVHELMFLSLDPPPTGHSNRSPVTDLFPFNVRVGVDGYIFGFVYRVRRVGITACDVFVDYWNSKTGNWTVRKVIDDLPLASQMEVVDTGRFVFVLVEGRSPAMFWLDKEDPYEFRSLGFSLTGDLPGPGKRPLLTAPGDTSDPPGSISSTGDPLRPAAGVIHLTEDDPTALGMGTSQEDMHKLEPGDYNFAYMLVDSRTGRKSALSETAEVRTQDFPSDSSSGETIYKDAFAVLELVYDSDEYDQAWVYRSVRTQDAGGTFSSSILFLDKIIDLNDYESSEEPPLPPLKRAIYYYEAVDKALVFQDVFLDYTTYDETLPHGGAGAFYDNVLLISKIRGGSVSTSEENRPGDLERSLGELRWSSLVYRSPELFPPSNRHVPRIPSNEIICLREVGSNLIGFSQDRQYFIRKDSIYLRIQQIHEGFGVVGPKAADTVGSLIYFMTHKGLKAVDSEGQLDDVRALNWLVLGSWQSGLQDVTISYDPVLSTVFIHHPHRQETVVLWLNTARITEIHDSFFSQVASGKWPSLPDVLSSTLTERTFFLQNSPDPDFDLPNWRPRVMVVDHLRTRTTPSLGTRVTLMPLVGESVRVTTSLMGTGGNVFLDGDAPEGCDGGYLYVLDSPDPAYIGRRVIIQERITPSQIRVPGGTGNLFGMPVGTTLAFSPVIFRWVGHPLSMQNDEGEFFDGPNFNRIKQLDSLSCAFTDVSGPAQWARFQALVYRGSEPIPYAREYPRDLEGNIIPSVVDGESIHVAAFGVANSPHLGGRNGVIGFSLTPGVEIIAPDLDFRLLEAVASGTIRGTLRSRRPS